MGGQMQQSNAALYDHPGNGGPAAGDAGDAVMARWLQSAGLQHLASPYASSGMIMQGYGAQSAEEKQRLFKLMRNLNFNGEPGSEPYTPTAQSFGGFAASDGMYSPEFRGDFGAGLLDLHSMDDTKLLTEEGLAPINLIVETDMHCATPAGTGGVKTIDSYAVAQSAAKAKGYSAVLYLDSVQKRYLEEVSSCNVFMVKAEERAVP